VAVLVLEAQVQLLERVPVIAHRPGHRVLALVQGRELQLVPGEGLFPVEQVRPLRIAGVPVDGDADQVAGDRAVAGIEQLAALVRAVGVAVVAQLGLVVLDDDAARRRLARRRVAPGLGGRSA
jgi:hypothetical protein